MLILGNLLWTTGQGTAPPPPVVVDISPPVGGGIVHTRRKRTREEVDREREALGIIEAIAQRQVETLNLDEQQRFEELSRELELRTITFETRYLEFLNRRRQALMVQEIAFRMRQLQNEEEEISIALMLSTL